LPAPLGPVTTRRSRCESENDTGRESRPATLTPSALSRDRAGSCREVGESEHLRRLRDGDGVRFECFLSPVHASARGPPARVARPCLLVPFSGRHPETRRFCALLRLSCNRACSACWRSYSSSHRSRSAATLPVPGIAVAVDARSIIGRGVEVDDRLRDIGQQRTIVADDDDPAATRAELRGQELEPASVEVVGGLIEQEEVVVCAEKARQRTRYRCPTERSESCLVGSVSASSASSAICTRRSASHASSASACSNAAAYSSSAPVRRPRERRRGRVEGRQSGEWGRDRFCDRLPTVRSSRRSSLVRRCRACRSLDSAAVRVRTPGEHVEKRRFASAVLANDRDARGRGDHEVDIMERRVWPARQRDAGSAMSCARWRAG
jgi:hypothetical protein